MLQKRSIELFMQSNCKLVSSVESMRLLDKKAIERGVSGIELMRRAADGIFKEVIAALPESGNVLFVCGKGNNGGDGFAAAEMVANYGYSVSMLLLSEVCDITGDALHYFSRVQGHKKISIIARANISSIKFTSYDIIVDAILGTGFKGKISGDYKRAIELINSSGVRVISVDAPSGINCNTGEVDNTAVQATTTVTFGLPKIGQLFYPAKKYVGRLKTHDIFTSPIDYESVCGKTALIDAKLASAGLRHRIGNEHKNSFGRVLVVSGSKGMTGAAVLCAKGAMRSGAGSVTLAVQESLNNIYEIKLTEEMTISLPDNGKGCFESHNVDSLIEIIPSFDVIAIGPGLGRSIQTANFTKQLLSKVRNIPIVIDADALFPFASNPALLGEIAAPIVLTPHSGELKRLIGIESIPETALDKVSFVRETGKIIPVPFLLKGGPTLVCMENEEVYINTSGNAGMATAGSGDVLTGLIAGLWAQQKNSGGKMPLLSATYIHGLAGDIAREKKTEYAMTAGDIVDSLAEAFRKVDKQNE